MARPKGFKLSDEQKKRMQAGRKAAKEKNMIGMVGTIEEKKPVKKECEVVGYSFNKGDRFPMPIFSSELSTFGGKIYRTVESAKEALLKSKEANNV